MTCILQAHVINTDTKKLLGESLVVFSTENMQQWYDFHFGYLVEEELQISEIFMQPGNVGVGVHCSPPEDSQHPHQFCYLLDHRPMRR